MARLEDLVTPTELLDAIKSGSMKDELIKQYRASEQDLALMLQPLYRGGRLTKDEFNNFFRGIVIQSQAPSEQKAKEKHADPNANSYDVPTEMLPTAALDAAPRPLPEEATMNDKVAGPETNLVSPEPHPIEAQPFAISEEIEADAWEPEEEIEPVALHASGDIAVLDMIYWRLNSIDQRLAQIEKKLGILS